MTHALVLGCHAVGLVLGLSYKKLSSDEDDNAALNHRGLGIKSRDLVLDLLEGQRLYQNQVSINSWWIISLVRTTYAQLLNDSSSTEDGGRLKSEHRLLALEVVLSAPQWPCWEKFGRQTHVETGQRLAVRVELVVVEFDELLCLKGSFRKRFESSSRESYDKHTSNVLKICNSSLVSSCS